MVQCTEVARSRIRLWKQLESYGEFNNLQNEEAEIRDRLESAFNRRVSTSILVIGPNGCGKKELVEKVLASYMTEGESNARPVSVARVNGLVHRNENQAVISLADQFLIRAPSDRNVNAAEEDLEEHLRVGPFNDRRSTKLSKNDDANALYILMLYPAMSN
jgi:Cdc6-like AAA superfamily ATPase